MFMPAVSLVEATNRIKVVVVLECLLWKGWKIKVFMMMCLKAVFADVLFQCC